MLTPSTEPGILTTHLSADGQDKDLLYVPMGVSSGWDRLRAGEAAWITMKGNEVFKVAVRTLSNLVDQTLEKAGVAKSEVDWLVPHQANIRIIEAAARCREPRPTVPIWIAYRTARIPSRFRDSSLMDRRPSFG